jgi:hypothetical protein
VKRRFGDLASRYARAWRPVRRRRLASRCALTDLDRVPIDARLPQPTSRTRTALQKGALITLVWTAFGLLSLTHFFLGKETEADGVAALGDLASHILVFYWAWAFVTPIAIVVGFDLAARVRRRGVAAMTGWFRVAAGVPVVVLAHAILYLSAVRVLRIEPAFVLDARLLGGYILRHGGGDVATYAAIIGLVFLIDAHRRARERDRAAAALEARLARADAELLRWQLQPHFLFNTLNTLSTLVLKGETASADRAIGLVARWLRAALAQRADACVALSDEMATVEQYVAIETLRFGEALQLDLDIDEEAANVHVPSLLVQPLVENSIRHGVAAGEDARPITIVARVRDRRLQLSVRNRGVAPPTAPHDGFGLRYVRERLGQFYGRNARLEIMRDAGDTIVTVDVPLMTAAPSDVARASPNPGAAA